MECSKCQAPLTGENKCSCGDHCKDCCNCPSDCSCGCNKE